MKTELSMLASLRASREIVTPLEFHEGLSRSLGTNIFLKREDKIDDLGSGHKRRKLDFLEEEAIKNGHDTIVTCGSVPSGQCVAVAAAARRWGIDSKLIYLGDSQTAPDTPSGNYETALVLAGSIDWFEKTAWNSVPKVLSNVENELRSIGKSPLVVPPGIPGWLPHLGSIELGVQIHRQIEELGLDSKQLNVVALAGTGGTYAGLSIASALFGEAWRSLGVAMTHTVSEELEKAVEMLIEQLLSKFANSVRTVQRPNIIGCVGSETYGVPAYEDVAAVWRYLKDFEIRVDPVYMIKVFRTIEALASHKVFSPEDVVVVVCSGGTTNFLSGLQSLDKIHEDLTGHQNLRHRTIKDRKF